MGFLLIQEDRSKITFKNTNQFNSIQMSFIGMRKHMFTLPKQVSKRMIQNKNKNNRNSNRGTYIQLEGVQHFL